MDQLIGLIPNRPGIHKRRGDFFIEMNNWIKQQMSTKIEIWKKYHKSWTNIKTKPKENEWKLKKKCHPNSLSLQICNSIKKVLSGVIKTQTADVINNEAHGIPLDTTTQQEQQYNREPCATT